MTFQITVDDFKNFGRLSCLISAFGAVQFLVITTIIALIYPGGYDYFNNYFSNLGQVVALNGSPNPIGNILFLVTLGLVGLSLIPFWLVMRSLFVETTIEKGLGISGALLGFVAVPLLIGVGLFPADTEPTAHVFAARYFFLAMGLAILVYSIAILFSRNYPNFFAIFGAAIFVTVLIYVSVDLDTLGPFVQKVIVYSYIVWTIIQLFRIWPMVEPSKT